MATAELKLFDAKGKEVGTAKGSAEVFGSSVSRSALHGVVRWQRARWRAGTHKVKTRAEVTGGGAKPWKQKGTGRARAGSNTSPIWVGGGIAHGPRPRDYEFSLNRRQRKLALSGALSARVQDEKCYVLQDHGLKEVKTSAAAAVLEALGVTRGKRAVVIVPDQDNVAKMSFRNLPKVKVIGVSGLNVYDLLNAEYVVLTEEALAGVEARFSGQPQEKKAKPAKKSKAKPAAKKAAGAKAAKAPVNEKAPAKAKAPKKAAAKKGKAAAKDESGEE